MIAHPDAGKTTFPKKVFFCAGGTRTVGALQFDVIAYRLEHEYGAKVSYEPLGLHKAYWIDESSDEAALKGLKQRRKANLARDTEGRLVYLAESEWMLKMAQDQHEGVVWRDASE